MQEVYRLIAAEEIECCRGAAKSAAETLTRANNEKSRQEVRLTQDSTSFGGEFSNACGAFYAPAFADPFLIFSCPRQSPS
jgi:hypothetical protein